MSLSDENPSDTNMHALKRETQLQIEAGITEGIEISKPVVSRR